VVALHAAIAIVLAIGLIIRFRVDPVISLILASLYLGLAAGVGFAGTIEAITVGFGGIMTEVGLLIGFGVLIGALLHSAGTFHRLVDVLVRAVGATRLPYALSTVHIGGPSGVATDGRRRFVVRLNQSTRGHDRGHATAFGPIGGTDRGLPARYHRAAVGGAY
jgi:Mg2+/citrate symporter